MLAAAGDDELVQGRILRQRLPQRQGDALGDEMGGRAKQVADRPALLDRHLQGVGEESLGPHAAGMPARQRR